MVKEDQCRQYESEGIIVDQMMGEIIKITESGSGLGRIIDGLERLRNGSKRG